MDETYTDNFSTTDPRFLARWTTIQSLNQMSREIKENKANIYSQIIFASTIIISIFLTVFANKLNWLVIILLLDTMLLILVFSAKNFKKRRFYLADEKDKIIKGLFELGVKIKN